MSVQSTGLFGCTSKSSINISSPWPIFSAVIVIFSPFDFHELIESHTEEELKELYSNGTVITFSGGTGHIGCSTDTAASMKAILVGADVIIKLTNVDGVYDKDPNKYEDAKLYKKLTHQEVLDNPEIKVMYLSCIEDFKGEHKDILVINFNDKENLIKVLNGESIGTVITSD